jgi:hypothetical protein
LTISLKEREGEEQQEEGNSAQPTLLTTTETKRGRRCDLCEWLEGQRIKWNQRRSMKIEVGRGWLNVKIGRYVLMRVKEN